MNNQPNTTVQESARDPTAANINVLIMYEDLPTAQRVQRVFDSLLQRCGNACSFRSEMWKFDTLRCPSISRIAAEDAEQADLIMVSAHGPETLPEEVQAWFSQWLSRRSNHHPAALVALLDKNQFGPDQWIEAQAYLKQIAQQAQMDFFALLTEAEPDLPIQRASREIDEAPPLLEEYCRKKAHPTAHAP